MLVARQSDRRFRRGWRGEKFRGGGRKKGDEEATIARCITINTFGPTFSSGEANRMTQCLPSWSRVSVALDILLVAVIIYQVLAMIRGARAAPMMAGVAVVALTFYLARIGELTTLNWLVSRLLPYVIFALIVVFQSEIRHVLSDVGRRVSFLRGPAVEGDSYDDIVLAANLFSQHQTGALIVIEREIGLRTYIESGVAMDAKLSYDLLATIFRPSAPLHDGAVIIQKDRLAAAACFLPLSMNPVLSTQMGTRHR